MERDRGMLGGRGRGDGRPREETTRKGGGSCWFALRATEPWSVLYKPQPCQITSASLPAPSSLHTLMELHTQTHTAQHNCMKKCAQTLKISSWDVFPEPSPIPRFSLLPLWSNFTAAVWRSLTLTYPHTDNLPVFNMEVRVFGGRTFCVMLRLTGGSLSALPEDLATNTSCSRPLIAFNSPPSPAPSISIMCDPVQLSVSLFFWSNRLNYSKEGHIRRRAAPARPTWGGPAFRLINLHQKVRTYVSGR